MNVETIKYYEINAESFTEDALCVSMGDLLTRFLNRIPAGGKVLDWGCGTGRDARAMLDAGYDVTASDASSAMCNIARSVTGIEITHEEFSDLNLLEVFDGIWASASLLHVTRQELPAVISKAACALKSNGILYCSFKYGTDERMRNGRFFTDMNETLITEMLTEVPELIIEDVWISGDVREGRESERWLNCIASKA